MCLYSLLLGHEPPHMRIHRTARMARGLHDIRVLRCVALHYRLQQRPPDAGLERFASSPFPGASLECELQ